MFGNDEHGSGLQASFWWALDVEIELRDFYISTPEMPTANLDDGNYSLNFEVEPAGTAGDWDVTLPPDLNTAFTIDSNGLFEATSLDPSDVGEHEIVVEFDDNNETHTRTYTLTIIEGDVTIQTTELPFATDGLNYEAQIETSGGTGNFEFEITGDGLPEGLSLDEETGVISGQVEWGTATEEEVTFPLTVTVEDLGPGGDEDTQVVDLIVRPLPEIDVSEFANVPLRSGDSWGPYLIEANITGGSPPFEVIVILSEAAIDAGLEYDDSSDEFGADEITDAVGAGDEVEVRFVAIDANDAITTASVILRGPPPVETVTEGGCGTLPGSGLGKLMAIALLLAFGAVLRRRLA